MMVVVKAKGNDIEMHGAFTQRNFTVLMTGPVNAFLLVLKLK